MSDLTSFLEAEPGKLDIKRHKPSILFISLQVFDLQTSDYDVNINFRVNATSPKRYKSRYKKEIKQR